MSKSVVEDVRKEDSHSHGGRSFSLEWPKRREAVYPASLLFTCGRIVNYRESKPVYRGNARVLLWRHMPTAIHRQPRATSTPWATRIG